MSKKHQAKVEEQQSTEGGADQAVAETLVDLLDETTHQGEVQPSDDEVVGDAEKIVEEAAQAEGAEPAEAKTMALGIGQFVRHLLKNSKKTNQEILDLVLKTFEGSKTTPACIAWYKSDMRKKGLLQPGASRGRSVIVELSEEQLAELVK
jgi:hypothetical protein